MHENIYNRNYIVEEENSFGKSLSLWRMIGFLLSAPVMPQGPTARPLGRLGGLQ